MATLKDIVFDSTHPASIARFWAATLDEYEISPYTEKDMEHLREKGIDDPEDDPTVLLLRTDGGVPRIFFQLVPEGKAVKNRMHMDLVAQDVATEVARLEGLGARIAADHGHLVTLTDPEGNEFCVLASA
ncbi:MAG: VOC family protein [Marmoricola sp.]